MIDDIDRSILSILQSNARTSNADVGRQVGLTPPAVLERIRKLEKKGSIRGYHARIDPEAVDLGLLAFVFLKTNERLDDRTVTEQIAAIPQVQEAHHVAGEDCHLVKVRVESPAALGRLLRETFGRIPGVISTRSTIVLETVKEDSCLSFDSPSDASRPEVPPAHAERPGADTANEGDER